MPLPVLQEHGQPDQESTHESPLPKPYDKPRILPVDDNVDAANTLAMLLQVNTFVPSLLTDGNTIEPPVVSLKLAKPH
jgi:PleD family two-component response regulator